MRSLLFFAALSCALAAEDKPQLPDAPGKATVLKVCGNCHGAEIVLGRPNSEEGWNAVIIDMVQRGAEGTDEEYDEVVRYLTKNIKALDTTKTNVNKATAKTLETALGLTAREAQSLVEARGNAAFKSIADIKKVPSIDAAKIEAKKDRISFE